MSSIWQENAQKPSFKALDGDIKTDVLIIGGGLTGILCAYMLDRAGVDYILIEQNEICSKVTSCTTAKVTAQHGSIYSKIIKEYGTDTAKIYYDLNSSAVERYQRLSEEIGAEYECVDAFVYSADNKEIIEDEIRAYKKIGVLADYVEDTSLPFSVAGAVRLKNQGQISPLDFLYRISKGLNIREHTKFKELNPQIAITDKGNIKYKKIIFATHFPILNKHGLFFLKMYQHRSYVLALKNAPKMNGVYVDADISGLSFRNHGDYLLFGGSGHKTGKKGESYTELSELAEKYYPEASVEYRFATQDCMTLDGIPYIGIYSKNTPNLLVATGYNKWGFTSSMVAAELLCDIIKGEEKKSALVFSPQRNILHPQLLLNGLNSITGLLTPTLPRCPHMGCALKYNDAEHSWDCPCHGSRFDEKGRVLNGPATGDLNL